MLSRKQAPQFKTQKNSGQQGSQRHVVHSRKFLNKFCTYQSHNKRGKKQFKMTELGLIKEMDHK